MTSYFEERMAELKSNPTRRKWYIDGAKPRPAKRVERQTHEYTGKIGHIYFAVADDHVKIGFATNMASRLESLQTGNHKEITIHESFTSYQVAEKILHKHFKADRVRGEWFKMSYEIEELWDDIMDYQGMLTTTGDPDAPGSGKAFLDAMPGTFMPLAHLRKILAYSGKPWPRDLFADGAA